MFDRIVVNETRTEHVPYEKTITEIKAPTDESIKLYKEIREKAYDSILQSFEIKSSIVELKGIFFLENPSSIELEYIIVYKINNKEFKVKGSFDKLELRQLHLRGSSFNVPEKCYDEVLKAVYKDFSDKIITGLFESDENILLNIIEHSK
jgi:Trm5-related predicted tRNA methylase